MLTIQTDPLVPEAIMERPGAFAWWYAEVMDEARSGVVLIWSFGLPFLPGIESAARAGTPQPPIQRPAINVACYRDGRPVFYSLQELTPVEIGWDGAEHWVFGDSEMRISRESGSVLVEADLDLAIVGSAERLVGRVRLAGPAPRGASHDIPGVGVHSWAPLVGPSFGTASLRFGESGLQVAGPGYCDRNYGDRALGALGIAEWCWGHAATTSEQRVFYALTSDDGVRQVVGVAVAEDGTMEVSRLNLTTTPMRRTLWGMPWSQGLTLEREGAPWLRLTHARPVDSGPFYLRFLAGSSHGVACTEVIVPARIDLSRHRPLVRMRVSPARRRPSMWLPLFSGAPETDCSASSAMSSAGAPAPALPS